MREREEVNVLRGWAGSEVEEGETEWPSSTTLPALSSSPRSVVMTRGDCSTTHPALSSCEGSVRSDTGLLISEPSVFFAKKGWLSSSAAVGLVSLLPRHCEWWGEREHMTWTASSL